MDWCTGKYETLHGILINFNADSINIGRSERHNLCLDTVRQYESFWPTTGKPNIPSRAGQMGTATVAFSTDWCLILLKCLMDLIMRSAQCLISTFQNAYIIEALGQLNLLNYICSLGLKTFTKRILNAWTAWNTYWKQWWHIMVWVVPGKYTLSGCQTPLDRTLQKTYPTADTFLALLPGKVGRFCAPTLLVHVDYSCPPVALGSHLASNLGEANI